MTKTNQNTKEFYTRNEAADALGVDVRTVDRLIKRGTLKAERAPFGRGIGGTRLFIPSSQVEELRAGAPASSSPKVEEVAAIKRAPKAQTKKAKAA